MVMNVRVRVWVSAEEFKRGRVQKIVHMADRKSN